MKTPEFLQLLTSHQSRIYAYILSLVFDPDQADDVLQQTNVVLWQKEGKSVNVVKQTLFRARTNLIKCVNANLATESHT